uniref:Uncharacterized protein n=1 Tax=Arundo donax TaxID=35708 RepID=A0A0A9BFX9_ARUDO
MQAILRAAILDSGNRLCIEMLEKMDRLHFEALEVT